MIIHTRSIKEARPGDLATYRWGRLGQFADGRIFAPSRGLLARYKAGWLSWKDYERHYLSEMESLYQRSPGHFLELLQRDEVTLVCYEAKPDKCHRRLLAGFMVRIGSEQGINVELDIR